MRVSNILAAKGTRVETIGPGEVVSRALLKLTTLGIGALVVSSNDRVLGVLSERDIVQGLHKHGGYVLGMPAAALMSKNVPVCSPEDTIRTVMSEMTRTRHRHVPVVSEGKLAGIVSLGDVVKHRLEEMELETRVLREAYIVHR